MKTVTLSVLIAIWSIFMISCGGAEMNEGNDLAQENLRGKVSMMRTTSYYDNSERGADTPSWKEQSLSSNGEEKHYSPAGMLIRTAYSSFISPYTYDEEGKLLNVKSINTDRGDFVASESKYHYDNGLLMKIDKYVWGKPSETVTYAYDDQKRVVKEITIDEHESSVYQVVHYIYDDESKKFSESDYQILVVRHYKEGKLIQETVDDRGDVTLTTYEYSGDRLKRSLVQGSDGSSAETTYGKSGEKLTSKDKTPLDSLRNRYNNYTYDYKYDNKGNWIECFCEREYYDEGEEPQTDCEKIVREITYYEE